MPPIAARFSGVAKIIADCIQHVVRASLPLLQQMHLDSGLSFGSARGSIGHLAGAARERVVRDQDRLHRMNALVKERARDGQQSVRGQIAWCARPGAHGRWASIFRLPRLSAYALVNSAPKSRISEA